MKTQSIWMPLLAAALVVSSANAQEHRGRDNNSKDTVRDINKNITIDDNARADDLSTVNGSITVGNHSEVGAAKTVNGSVTLGADSRATNLGTVNGTIEVGPRSTVSGDISTVNGRLNVSDDATVLGNAKSVNGKVILEKNAHVGQQLISVMGDITLKDKARIDGGILMKKRDHEWNRSSDSSRHLPVITIGPGAEVRGELVFESPVKLRVHSTAQIGPVKGAEVERF